MDQQIIVFAILILAIIGFVSGKIPSCVVALGVMCTLYITGCIQASDMVAGFSNSAVILTMAMLIVSGALLSCGFAQVLGKWVLKIVSGERNVMLAVFLLGCVLAGFISAMGTVSVLTPLVIGVCQQDPKQYRLGKLMMPCAIAATTGGMLTSIGKPPNVYVNSFLIENGYGAMKFFEFAKVGLPIMIAFTVFLYFWGYKMFPDTGIDPAVFSSETSTSQKKPWQKIVCFVIFLLTMLMLVFERFIGVPSQIAALLGASAMMISFVISPKEAFKSVQWETIFLLAGMLPLAKAMVNTGAAVSIANFLLKLLGSDPSPILVVAVLFATITMLTEFMSNVACCTLFAPIGMALAEGLGLNPVSVILAIGIAGGCSFMTPVGNPLATYVMQFGGYSFKDYMKPGAWLNLISWIIGVGMISICWPL